MKTPTMTCLLAAAALCGAVSSPAATVHLQDIVASPVAMNNFQLAPANLVSTWSEQGIRVRQMDGAPAAGIWLAAGLGVGNRAWYPNGGDDGWTRLTLDSGENFDAVTFFGGSGWLSPPQSMYFELADDGLVVLSGTLAATFSGSWYGFAGGDFDEVRLRASGGVVSSLTDCPSGGAGSPSGIFRCNFAWVDEIQVGAFSTVPEPGSASLVALALLGLGMARRRSR